MNNFNSELISINSTFAFILNPLLNIYPGRLLIPLKKNLFCFELKKFSVNIFIWSTWKKIFWSFRAFCREQKRGKSFDTRSGEYSGLDKTDKPKFNIFFLRDSYWMLPCIIMKKPNISPTDKCGAFS